MKSNLKSKVRHIFDLYRANLITLSRVIAELQKIHSETVLKQFAERLELDSMESVLEKENNNGN